MTTIYDVWQKTRKESGGKDKSIFDKAFLEGLDRMGWPVDYKCIGNYIKMRKHLKSLQKTGRGRLHKIMNDTFGAVNDALTNKTDAKKWEKGLAGIMDLEREYTRMMKERGFIPVD